MRFAIEPSDEELLEPGDAAEAEAPESGAELKTRSLEQPASKPAAISAASVTARRGARCICSPVFRMTAPTPLVLRQFISNKPWQPQGRPDG
jgi:hypothetical protein